mmetsp:Transcript_1839/g.5346  ORF Transcript_1839/g.5346 Transcript_1839/m.5346 type:complete len:346 (-) Transcript_1839:285-1322(-)
MTAWGSHAPSLSPEWRAPTCRWCLASVMPPRPCLPGGARGWWCTAWGPLRLRQREPPWRQVLQRCWSSPAVLGLCAPRSSITRTSLTTGMRTSSTTCRPMPPRCKGGTGSTRPPTLRRPPAGPARSSQLATPSPCPTSGSSPTIWGSSAPGRLPSLAWTRAACSWMTAPGWSAMCWCRALASSATPPSAKTSPAAPRLPPPTTWTSISSTLQTPRSMTTPSTASSAPPSWSTPSSTPACTSRGCAARRPSGLCSGGRRWRGWILARGLGASTSELPTACLPPTTQSRGWPGSRWIAEQLTSWPLCRLPPTRPPTARSGPTSTRCSMAACLCRPRSSCPTSWTFEA